MAILKQNLGSSKGRNWAVLALLALTASGCLVMDQLGWLPAEKGFSHRLHVEEEELYCIDCHMGYLDEEEAGFPRLKACMLCHEDIDEEAEPERRAESFFEDGKLVVERVNDLDMEVKFSHMAHVSDDEESCMGCHAEIAKSDAVQPWMGLDMQDCVRCHEDQGQDVSCQACHEELRVDAAPRTHSGDWGQFHGLEVRAKSTLTVDRCDMCHEESTCTSCHQEQEPQSHNNFWRQRAHGLMAQMDRDNCAACHRPDYCDRCHTEAVPQSHNGLWGGSRNTHCFGCHESEAQQSCNLCHKAGATSHQLSPPKPPGHNPASDCRTCHMILPHVDNGADCNSCHL